jgi:hypothetical protein
MVAKYWSGQLEVPCWQSVKERFKFLDMTTLETRRIRGDLIEVFEILKGIEDVKEE